MGNRFTSHPCHWSIGRPPRSPVQMLRLLFVDGITGNSGGICFLANLQRCCPQWCKAILKWLVWLDGPTILVGHESTTSPVCRPAHVSWLLSIVSQTVQRYWAGQASGGREKLMMSIDDVTSSSDITFRLITYGGD